MLRSELIGRRPIWEAVGVLTERDQIPPRSRRGQMSFYRFEKNSDVTVCDLLPISRLMLTQVGPTRELARSVGTSLGHAWDGAAAAVG